jgi:SlyX protein
MAVSFVLHDRDGPARNGSTGVEPCGRNVLMSGQPETNQLEQRLVELETRLTFQEQALGELNEALSETRLEAAANAALLRRLFEDIKLTRGDFGGDAASEPPPPHY